MEHLRMILILQCKNLYWYTCRHALIIKVFKLLAVQSRTTIEAFNYYRSFTGKSYDAMQLTYFEQVQENEAVQQEKLTFLESIHIQLVIGKEDVYLVILINLQHSFPRYKTVSLSSVITSIHCIKSSQFVITTYAICIQKPLLLSGILSSIQLLITCA